MTAIVMPTSTVSALTAPSIRKNGNFLFSPFSPLPPPPPFCPPGYIQRERGGGKPLLLFPSFSSYSISHLPTLTHTLFLSFSAGKHWHAQKSAFRPRAGQSSYSARVVERKALEATKLKEKEMKEEKEAERQVNYIYIYICIYIFTYIYFPSPPSSPHPRHTHRHTHITKKNPRPLLPLILPAQVRRSKTKKKNKQTKIFDFFHTHKKKFSDY